MDKNYMSEFCLEQNQDMNTLEQVIQEKDIYINFLETTISELEEKLIS